VTTIVLGSNGKLGAILASHARRAGLDWRFQARGADADICWSGRFDTVPDGLFTQGGTLINMIGSTDRDANILHSTNVRFVQDLLAKAAKSKVAHVILASSAAVYGEGETPLDETAALNPKSPYGISKAAMEQAAVAFDDPNAPAVTILRIGNVAGADALSKAAQRHSADGTQMPLHRYEDGSFPIRSYIGPKDLFRVIHRLSKQHSAPTRVVNITHPQPVALNDLLAAYRAKIGPNLRSIDTPAPDGTPKAVTLSSTEVEKLVMFDVFQDPATAFAKQAADHLIA